MFRPVGDRAQWRVIYDEVRKMGQGEIITYDRLSNLIDRDVRYSRAPIERATRELENEDRRTLVCVRGEGYRIAAATEHESLANRHTARSRRQLTKAVQKVRSADRSQLTPEQAARLDVLEARCAEHASMLKRLSDRDEQRATELRNLRRETTGDIANLSSEVEQLKQLLQRHGITGEEDQADQNQRPRNSAETMPDTSRFNPFSHAAPHVPEPR